MIYLDSSVALAQLLGEARAPPEALWRERLASSRLLEFEVWSRLHARRLGPSHGPEARRLLSRVGLFELTADVLARASEPFPAPVRTLDALHLATLHYLREQGQEVELASCDQRLLAAARALGISCFAP